MLHYCVVAFMSVFYGVPHRRLVVVLLGKGSLFVHVSSPDELDAEVVPEDLGGLNLVSYNLLHPFQVALETIHYDGLIVNVELVGELLAKGLNGSLHESLLSVDVKHAVLVRGMLSNFNSLFGEALKNFKVPFRNPNTTTDGDLGQDPLMLPPLGFIKLEKVGIRVNLKVRNLFTLVVWEFE